MEGNGGCWCDCLFYDLFIARYQDRAFACVKEILDRGSVVLDVGCGTGRLACQLLDKCERVEIIDSSEEKIGVARCKLAGVPREKLTIECADVVSFVRTTYNHFDFAVVSYATHQLGEEERDVLLWGLSAVADKIVIIDHLVPQPRNYCGILFRLYEYGQEYIHYRNFRSFVKGGGIQGVLEKVPLRILNDIKDYTSLTQVFVVEGKTRGRRASRPIHQLSDPASSLKF